MQLSRRKLIAGGASLAGASAVVLLTEGPSHATGQVLRPAELDGLDTSLMLSITDASAGRCEILVGERAVTFTDRALVARLARAIRSEAS